MYKEKIRDVITLNYGSKFLWSTTKDDQNQKKKRKKEKGRKILN